MKNYRIILAAFAAMGLLSCTKEIQSENAPAAQNVVKGTETVTFSASLPESGVKGYDADGKVKWETTDCIYITTDAANSYVSNGNIDANGAKVALNGEGVTISEDGRCATFSVSGLPAGATKYFAVAVDNTDGGMLYGTYANGNVLSAIGRQAGFNNANKRHMAVASCSASSTVLNFSPAGAIIKFTNPDGAVKSLKIEGVAGETVCQYYAINAETKAVTLMDHTYNQKFIKYNWANTGTHYLFIAPGIEFAQGMKVTAYSDNEWTTSIGTYTTKAFTTAAGKMYNLGDIAQKVEKEYTSNWEKWNDGKNIVIGNKTYNKNTFGAPSYNVHHITEDATDLSVYESGAYFVDPGLTVNFKSLGGSPADIEVFVIGNTIGTRSEITLGGDAWANCMGYKVALGNLTVNYGSAQKLFRTDSNRNMGYFVIDDCQINYQQSFVADAQIIEDLYIVNSDINMNNSSNDHMCMMIRQPASGKTGTSIVLKNNQFYSSEFKKMHVISTTGLAATDAVYDKVVVENNTFYNTYQADAAQFLIGLGSVTTSGTVKNNLVYAPSSKDWDYAFCCISAKGSDKTLFTVSGNKVNVFVQDPGYPTGWPFGKYVLHSADAIWISPSDAFNEDPFNGYDATTGTYTSKKSAYVGIGANRNDD